MMKNSHPQLFQKLNRFFVHRKTIQLAYIFGSHASDAAGPISDYDLAILFDKSPAPEEKYETAHQLALLLESDRVDLVCLNNATIELKYAVIATGILLYERSTFVKVEFEADTLSRYGDYLPILRQQKMDIIKDDRNEAGIQRYRKALGKTQRMLEKIRTV